MQAKIYAAMRKAVEIWPSIQQIQLADPAATVVVRFNWVKRDGAVVGIGMVQRLENSDFFSCAVSVFDSV